MKTQLQFIGTPCNSLLRYLLLFFGLIMMLCMLQSCNYFTYSGSDETPEPDSTVYMFIDPPAFSGTFAFTHNNDIYINDGSGSWPVKITDSPEKEKGLLALSYDKKKIAYLNDAGIPEIIGIDGNFLEMAAPSGTVRDMGWSPNSGTLYMLVGNTLEYHGPPMPVAQPSRPIHSLHIAQNLDMVYCYSATNSSNTTVRVDFYDPNKRDRLISLNGRFNYVRISYEGSYFLAAFTSQQENPWSASIQNEVHVGLINNSSGSRENRLKYSSSPIFLGRDSVIFALGPNDFRDDEDVYGFSNIFVSGHKILNGASYASNFQTKSDITYIDWKP